MVNRSTLAWGYTLPELPGTALGEALRAHLNEEGYTGKRVAVGLPGAWVLARRWDVPPVDDAARAGIVRMRVEKEFASGPARLAFDFVDVLADGGAGGVLLVGVREDRLSRGADDARRRRAGVGVDRGYGPGRRPGGRPSHTLSRAGGRDDDARV